MAAAPRAKSPGYTAHFFLVVIAREYVDGGRWGLVKLFTRDINGGNNALARVLDARARF